jgi:hypothetical protein
LLEKAVSNIMSALQLRIDTTAQTEGIRSKMPNDETATRLIATFIAKLKATIPTSFDPAQDKRI